ncbi:MAG: hypothetical protein WBM98_04610 [Maribacter sp.]|uniref:hypothetical protein n=1 Tax=Maribacter sp. TaxID=1897614 RepID=UPI003C761202
MEEVTTFYSWKGLLYLMLLLMAIYWATKLIAFVVKGFFKRNITNKRIAHYFDKLFMLYKPVAFVLVLLDFISINYITHGILLLILSVFGYQHIRNYISGLFFKTNPLVEVGAQITTNTLRGEINTLLPFGFVLNTENGEHYLGYTAVESEGFSVHTATETTLRQTLYLRTELNKEEILNLLFDNPILDFEEVPSLKTGEHPGTLRLQYTLEKGAAPDDLIAYFNTLDIETNLTASTD